MDLALSGNGTNTKSLSKTRAVTNKIIKLSGTSSNRSQQFLFQSGAAEIFFLSTGGVKFSYSLLMQVLGKGSKVVFPPVLVNL